MWKTQVQVGLSEGERGGACHEAGYLVREFSMLQLFMQFDDSIKCCLSFSDAKFYPESCLLGMVLQSRVDEPQLANLCILSSRAPFFALFLLKRALQST
jgi:hypothetical protein